LVEATCRAIFLFGEAGGDSYRAVSRRRSYTQFGASQA
jgi:hypothetical protein